jgi:hypothetical protein
MHGSSFSVLKPGQPPIYVLGSLLEGKGAEELQAMSSAFDQARFTASISRLFVPSEQFERASTIMNSMSVQPVQQSLL